MTVTGFHDPPAQPLFVAAESSTDAASAAPSIFIHFTALQGALILSSLEIQTETGATPDQAQDLHMSVLECLRRLAGRCVNDKHSLTEFTWNVAPLVDIKSSLR